ncbi:Hint domain-containing protein [Rhodobacter sp. JA431]|uniref:Hint domain-containing protein n=1 Tax=Rhodobacter sp. JA431 TaxID=570013 RepID=UPI000BE41C7C|nr:Hint domain-containing protein [Rhodobacter sp. JA431]
MTRPKGCAMSYSHRVGTGQVSPVLRPQSQMPAGQPRKGLPTGKTLRAMPLTRRYEAMWLGAEGEILDSTRLAPAMPLFEEAFSALARGAVLATTQGPVAVEDLVPGMQVMTAEGAEETVTWVGSMVIYPGRDGADGGAEPVTLTRVTAEALGAGRPMQDVVLGPRARLCLHDTRLRRVAGYDAAYVPARAFVDGVSVIEVTPVAPVTVYHVVLQRHGSLKVAGLEVEAFHPGEGVERMIDPRMLSLFAAQFPQMPDLSGFGPQAHPRLTRFEVESLWD